MKILEDVYTAYLDTLRPSERLYCPPVDFLRPIPAVLKLLEADKGTNITAKNFQPLKQHFKKYIADHQGKVRMSLKTEETKRQVTYTGDPFDLARFVYRRSPAPRRKCRTPFAWADPEDLILVGWSMIGTHATQERKQLQLRDGVWIPIPAGFDLNFSASPVSAKLIELAGLDPKTTTVAEMDACDPRFVFTQFLTEAGYPVLTWRTAVSSCRSTHSPAYI
jgi:hypothetical protein